MIAKHLLTRWALVLEMAVLALLLCACHRHPESTAAMGGESSTTEIGGVSAKSGTRPDACELALVPHAGEGRIDRQIIRLQADVRNGQNATQSLERLGWTYVAKARESFDPGFYKLAEQCALCLDARQPGCAEAVLLRGHVLQNLHRFKEAEPLARDLVARRGLSFDYGLLGDVLMEDGRLSEAAAAYQKMVDEKPDLQGYARIAHLRWLKGDLQGATEIMLLASGAASPNAPEAAAWVNSRLAFFLFQKGSMGEAFAVCDLALSYQKDYPPALLLRGRLLLAEGRDSDAVGALQRAAQLNPLPEYQWVLSEALHASGRNEEAREVEDRLARHGAAADPRTFALYLASRGESLPTALELAERELHTRGDVFTHDALAWALAAAGRIGEALPPLQQALAEGTSDARLFFHAAVLHAKAGHKQEASRFWQAAMNLSHLLLPSERERLQLVAGEVDNDFADDIALGTGPTAFKRTGD